MAGAAGRPGVTRVEMALVDDVDVLGREGFAEK